MSIPFGRFGGVLLAGAIVGAAIAAPAPTEEGDVKDRKEFIPIRKYQAMPGTTIGVLVSDVGAMMGQDGRGGPADAFAFSTAGGSYRWVYTPANGVALISNLQVKVGEKGDKIVVYPALNMANADTVKQWDIKVPYALVEVDVNDAKGAPADESFVGTRMKRLDDTKEYPLLVPEVIASLRDRYVARVKDMKKSIDDALDAEAKNVKLTGPRETAELLYITWLPESERLCVRFRTTITDGAYRNPGGANPYDRTTAPLSQPKDTEKDKVEAKDRDGIRVFVKDKALKDTPAKDTVIKDMGVKDAVFVKDTVKDAAPRLPPQPIGFRSGTQYGVEFGVSYEVSKTGKLVRVDTLPVQGFHRELPPAPGARGPLNPPVPIKD